MSQLPEELPLVMTKGSTFSRVIRWEEEPFIYKAITGISKTAPVRVTAVGHGMPDGWRAAIVSVVGMRQINAEVDDRGMPLEREFHRGTVIDVDTVDFNTINAAGFSTYESGGYLQFYTPKSLAGCTARMTVKDRIGGTALLTLTSGDGITLNDTDKTITISVSATDTAAFDWAYGVYDLEIQDADGVVTKLYTGPVTVKDEATT